jgi:hypothetical protein
MGSGDLIQRESAECVAIRAAYEKSKHLGASETELEALRAAIDIAFDPLHPDSAAGLDALMKSIQPDGTLRV